MKKCASLALAAALLWLALGLGGASFASTATIGPLDENGLRARSRRVLGTLAARHGLAVDADLQEKALALDRLGMAHRRLQQSTAASRCWAARRSCTSAPTVSSVA